MGLGIIWQWVKKGYWDRTYKVDENGILCFEPRASDTPPDRQKDPFADKDYYLYEVKLSPFRDAKTKRRMVGIEIPDFDIKKAVSMSQNSPSLAPLLSWLDASATVHFSYRYDCHEKLKVRLRDQKTGYLFDPENGEARIYRNKKYQLYVAPADARSRPRGVFPGWA